MRIRPFLMTLLFLVLLFLLPLIDRSGAMAAPKPVAAPQTVVAVPAGLLQWAQGVGNSLTLLSSQTHQAISPALAPPPPQEPDHDADDALIPTSDHINLLARIIEAEAGNQPFQGQVAVGAVVVNRVKSPYYAKTLSGVIFTPGAFEPVANGRFYSCHPTPQAYAAAKEALAGIDPTSGALYFFNPSLTSSAFMNSLPVLARIGAQVFAA